MAVRLQPLHQEIVDQLPLLRALARSLTRDPPEADDLVQETLAKAIAHIDQFSPGTNLRAWLCTIERNTFYTNYHRKAREPLLDVAAMPEVCVQPQQEWSVRLRAVDRALQALPVDQREAVMLVGGAGMSYEEAAVICDCALGTIKSRVSRGRAALQQHLDSAGDNDFLEEPAERAVPTVIAGARSQG